MGAHSRSVGNGLERLVPAVSGGVRLTGDHGDCGAYSMLRNNPDATRGVVSVGRRAPVFTAVRIARRRTEVRAAYGRHMTSAAYTEKCA